MEYMDVALSRLATELDHRPSGWSAEAVRRYRETVQCVDAAKTAADLRALRSLRMLERRELKPGAWSIALDETRDLIFTFRSDALGAIAVLELLDCDQEVTR